MERQSSLQDSWATLPSMAAVGAGAVVAAGQLPPPPKKKFAPTFNYTQWYGGGKVCFQGKYAACLNNELVSVVNMETGRREISVEPVRSHALPSSTQAPGVRCCANGAVGCYRVSLALHLAAFLCNPSPCHAAPLTRAHAAHPAPPPLAGATRTAPRLSTSLTYVNNQL